MVGGRQGHVPVVGGRQGHVPVVGGRQGHVPVVGGRQGHVPVKYFCSSKSSFVSVEFLGDNKPVTTLRQIWQPSAFWGCYKI